MIDKVEVKRNSEAEVETEFMSYSMDHEVIALIDNGEFHHRILMKEIDVRYFLAFVVEEDNKCVLTEVERSPETVKEHLEGSENEQQAIVDLFETGLQGPRYEGTVHESDSRPSVDSEA
ncbi:hypothetical protein [Salinibacter ruber]|jgi:hypothetical protein|uniref:Uncharacterized protein n=1 Tax=Salinibacter ruber TaxID=146919 RepID=A0AAW5P517_9BACT|nr:hypothetical protein [Salinibacter ruber]MCS4156921.1 hypothetical protein [Salinibacter ruber]MCS4182175.1 hypothetical protein [Salinibacter ruber]